MSTPRQSALRHAALFSDDGFANDSFAGSGESTSPDGPTDPCDEYDRAHRRPEAKPTADEQWGLGLNPLRETPLAAVNMVEIGGPRDR